MENPPENSNPGYKIEHILLSVTVMHTRGIGQFDDSCAHQIEQQIMEYKDVILVEAKPQYQHCKEETHFAGCECGWCSRVKVSA